MTKQLFLLSLMMISTTSFGATINCQLHKARNLSYSQTVQSGPYSGTINAVLDNGSVIPAKISLNTLVIKGNNRGQFMEMNDSSISNLKVKRFYLKSKDSEKGGVGHMILKHTNDKIIISDADEVEEFRYEFNLRTHSLILKRRLAYSFGLPKQTVDKFKYFCR